MHAFVEIRSLTIVYYAESVFQSTILTRQFINATFKVSSDIDGCVTLMSVWSVLREIDRVTTTTGTGRLRRKQTCKERRGGVTPRTNDKGKAMTEMAGSCEEGLETTREGRHREQCVM